MASGMSTVISQEGHAVGNLAKRQGNSPLSRCSASQPYGFPLGCMASRVQLQFQNGERQPHFWDSIGVKNWSSLEISERKVVLGLQDAL